MVSVHSSLVITGFMGTGKTSVGWIVAKKLNRDFVDMDLLIEEREGKTIPKIFALNGEAHFRTVESELCRELAASHDLVIATGGGALVDSENLAAFRDAFVVCLDASVEEIAQRLARAKNRPLLSGDSLTDRVQTLYEARRTAYAKIEQHVNTTRKSFEQVANEIVEMFENVT